MTEAVKPRQSSQKPLAKIKKMKKPGIETLLSKPKNLKTAQTRAQGSSTKPQQKVVKVARQHILPSEIKLKEVEMQIDASLVPPDQGTSSTELIIPLSQLDASSRESTPCE